MCDIDSLRSSISFLGLELDLGAFFDLFTFEIGDMEEHIVTSILRLDEAVLLLVMEEGYSTSQLKHLR